MNLLYYSTQSKLAHKISEKYYKKFYVYITKEFDASSTNPPSSNPLELYQDLRYIATRNDLGGVKYRDAKTKILRVARKMKSAGKITDDEFKEIQKMVKLAQPRDLAPRIYLIVSGNISPSRIQEVPYEEKANGDSQEFIISDLDFTEFDCIEGL